MRVFSFFMLPPIPCICFAFPEKEKVKQPYSDIVVKSSS